MVTGNAGRMRWVLGLVALAAIAASGHGLAWAQAARNETAASANGQALDALLSTTSRAFSASECVESIRLMKHSAGVARYPDWSPEISTSFPKDDTLIPPGAEAWCNCLRDNEPVGGIPSDYEGVFDTCRDQVMVGSDYNAMDLCRGMPRLFGDDFLYKWTTFCSRQLCPRLFSGTNRLLQFYDGDAGDMYVSCEASCVHELAAGYCSKYRLTYGGWVFENASGSQRGFGDWHRRVIAVDKVRVARQIDDPKQFWLQDKVDAARDICDILYPTDQARCCTYERGLATLSQCCYEKNGALEFNCNKAYGGSRLRYNCGRLGNDYENQLGGQCSVMIDYYVAHPTYRQATLAELPSGQTSVVFPEAFMEDFCDSQEFSQLRVNENKYTIDSTPGTREYCCDKIRILFGEFVENCQPGAGSHPSLGATRLPPGPQPTRPPGASPRPRPPPPSCDPCSYVDERGDCQSVCKGFQECTVRKGRAICVRCDYFWQEFADGRNRQCCVLRGGDSGPLCKTRVTNKGEKKKCFLNQGPWTNNRGFERWPLPFTVDAAKNVCNGRNNFWVNKKMCKVKFKANGQMICKYISKRKRESILAL